MRRAGKLIGDRAALAARRAARVLALVAGAWGALRRNRRERARLLELDDHLLADIGLTRDEVRYLRAGSVAPEAQGHDAARPGLAGDATRALR